MEKMLELQKSREKKEKELRENANFCQKLTEAR